MRKWTKVRYYIFLVVQEHKSFWIFILASWPISASHYLFPVQVHPMRKTDLLLQSGCMSDAAALMANVPSKYNKYYVEGCKILKANAVFFFFASHVHCFLFCLALFLRSGHKMSTLLFKWVTSMSFLGIFRAPCVAHKIKNLGVEQPF